MSFLCGRVLLQRTLHKLDTAREPFLNFVWSIRVRIPEWLLLADFDRDLLKPRHLHCQPV